MNGNDPLVNLPAQGMNGINPLVNLPAQGMNGIDPLVNLLDQDTTNLPAQGMNGTNQDMVSSQDTNNIASLFHQQQADEEPFDLFSDERMRNAVQAFFSNPDVGLGNALVSIIILIQYVGMKSSSPLLPLIVKKSKECIKSS